MSTLSTSLLDVSRGRLGSKLWSRGSVQASSGRYARRRLAHDFAAPSGAAELPPPLYDPQARTPRGRRPRMSRSTLGALPVRTPVTGAPPAQVDPFAELQRRVEDLQANMPDEVASPADPTSEPDLPPFSEADLLGLYEDVLSLPEDAPRAIAAPDAVLPKEREVELVQGVYERLFPREELDSDASTISTRSTTSTLEFVPSTETVPVPSTSGPLHSTVLSRVRDLVSKMEASKGFQITTAVPVALLSTQEWEALTRVAMREQDGEAMESALHLMKRTGAVPSEELVSSALELYADVGDVARTEAFMAQFVDERPSERQRDLHVKAHLRHAPQYTVPHSALSLLHTYESRAIPAPIKTYSRTISSLFAVRSTGSLALTPSATDESPLQAHGQAWDLFAHMRYAAHPNPDLALYTQMLRACALPASGRTSPFSPLPTSEPERALDLWSEMTVDARIVPDVHAYEAIISACARTGQSRYVDEAFRLARECLDGERDARGRARFAATPAMCRALLDGAKRVGALGRARWILAEMVRVARSGQWAGAPTTKAGDVVDVEPIVDERTMMHIFHAYASYRPPFRRGLARMVDGQTPENQLDPPELVKQAADAEAATSSSPPRAATHSNSTMDVVDDHGSSDPPPQSSPVAQAGFGSTEMNITDPSFPTHVPQSRAEVLAEASFLFSRILDSRSADREAASTHEALEARDFADVQITPRLVNSHLAVYYAHGSTDACRARWTELWSRVAPTTTPIARSFVEALERCANARRGRDREAALAWTQEELWPAWEAAEQTWRRGESGLVGVDARMVERAQAAFIRLLAVNGLVKEAVAQLRTFTMTYPPTAVREPARPLAMRSTRTVLVGARPLVRLTAAAHVPDDVVPPLLTFADLEILYHRLVTAQDKRGIAFVHWVGKAYEGELRRRRQGTMMALASKKKNAVAVV